MRTPLAIKLAALREATDRIMVDMAPRKGFTPVQRRAVWERDGGRCCACGVDLQPGWHIDHILPRELGGAHEMDNWQALCAPCHKEKTKGDNRRIAKSRRLRKADAAPVEESSIQSNHKIQSRGFDKTRSRKMSGKVEPRRRKGD